MFWDCLLIVQEPDFFVEKSTDAAFERKVYNQDRCGVKHLLPKVLQLSWQVR